MGHERVGTLPRTRKWLDVIEAIQPSSGSTEGIADLSAKTLENVRSRFLRIHHDDGVGAAFGFLITLAATERKGGGSLTSVEIALDQSPSPGRLATELNRWVRAHRISLEYAELAQRAAADTIAAWTTKELGQINLFGSGQTAKVVWKSAANAGGFCEVARLFFAKFTERYLRYFLEREASACIQTISEREQFGERLKQHIDMVSQHAFETAKITQSFAAGWYNNHVKSGLPADSDIRDFLRLSFGKIREELLREKIS